MAPREQPQNQAWRDAEEGPHEQLQNVAPTKRPLTEPIIGALGVSIGIVDPVGEIRFSGRSALAESKLKGMVLRIWPLDPTAKQPGFYRI